MFLFFIYNFLIKFYIINIMNKIENKGTKFENIKYQLNINDIINKIKKEFEGKIKDNQFFYNLIENYISLTNDYKNKI